MDESMYQRCIYCGKMISDYRNTMQPAGQGPIKGFAAGEVYVQDGNVNPRETTTMLPTHADVHDCRDEEKEIE
jgi:hypothetical protein